MLISVEDKKAVVRRGYDLVSRAYRTDDAEEGVYSEWLDLLEQRVEPRAAVLDLGCGNGIPVARRLASRYEVTGVDFSSMQIERARALVPAATFHCADVTRVEFAGASFAAVTCLYALIHLPLDEQLATLRSIRRWLRPGGLFMTTVGHRAWTGIERSWLGVEGGDMWWSHADADTYRRWVTNAGLKIERESFIPEGTGGHTFILAIC